MRLGTFGSLVGLAALGALAASACGGSTSTGNGGSGATAGAGGGSGPCPAMQPANGAACTPPYASTGFSVADCSYGDDPRPQCRVTASCSSGVWQVTLPSCPAPPLPAACSTPPPPVGSTCSDSTLACWYADGSRCWCSGCAGGSEWPLCQPIDPPQWACAAPPSGCPTVAPQAGSTCSTPGASCGPDCTLPITCTDGIWQWGNIQCPICAAPDTPIATPSGERPIASLRAGDLVYSVDHDAIVAVPLLQVGHTPVTGHHVLRLLLDDGRVLEISPRHPTGDGRLLGDLLAGARLDPTHTLAASELVPYQHEATFDILPASSTGTYFAAGAWLGSTLGR
jgi:hypothetical protein